MVLIGSKLIATYQDRDITLRAVAIGRGSDPDRQLRPPGAATPIAGKACSVAGRCCACSAASPSRRSTLGPATRRSRNDPAMPGGVIPAKDGVYLGQPPRPPSSRPARSSPCTWTQNTRNGSRPRAATPLRCGRPRLDGSRSWRSSRRSSRSPAGCSAPAKRVGNRGHQNPTVGPDRPDAHQAAAEPCVTWLSRGGEPGDHDRTVLLGLSLLDSVTDPLHRHRSDGGGRVSGGRRSAGIAAAPPGWRRRLRKSDRPTPRVPPGCASRVRVPPASCRIPVNA